MKAIAIPAAVGIGVLLALQPAVNAEMARRLGSPYFAALVSLAISLVLLMPLGFAEPDKPSLSTLKSLPLWIIIGGLAGACYVTGGILIAPALGVALFVLCIVLGQTLGASFVDQFGLFGLEKKSIDPWKTAGIVLMVSGLVVFQRGNS